MPRKRKVCYVTGTRAEFGLMMRALRAIQRHPSLELQLVVTGMHLDARHGKSVEVLRRAGWKIDATVGWRSTGEAIAMMESAFKRLAPDIVLVTGDRVEAFAGASAGFLSNRIVAHVHGGDRALGQVDDTLRHAITKLAHVHFAATSESEQRILKLGEDPWRVHRVGSPGLEGIREDASHVVDIQRDYGVTPGRCALLVLHPVDADESIENRRAKMTLDAIRSCGIERTIIVYPNNDPGSPGIIRCWESAKGDDLAIRRDVSRADFLGLMRDAAILVGNSSSGIIEAASFGTPVVDIGPRQLGRLCSQNVTHVPYGKEAIRTAISRIWNNGKPRRARTGNVYAGRNPSQRIARVLADVKMDERLRRKLIAY